MSEINDEQLQEFEAKLEALTQRLEDFEISPDTFDPFDLYDVERMLEDFRTKEQSLNSEVEGSEVEVSEVEESFSFEVGSVSKKSPVFEVHWIGIDECGVSSCESILSNVEAKSAFLNAIDYRADYSNGKRRVKHGDLLILLCRNSGNLAEDAPEGSEPLTKSCTYMGMFTRHGYRQSEEPDALPVVESKISDSNDYGDVFVWSSCSDVVCDESPTTVDISTGSQLTTSSGSPVGEELEFLTDIKVVKSNDENGYTDRGLIIHNDIVSENAGLYGGLTNLSTKLTNWYVDYNKLNFKPKADVGSLAQSAGSFNTLSSDQCGNLLLTPEDSSGDSASTTLSSFNKNFEVSLGNLKQVDSSEIEGVLAIPSIDLGFTDYGTNTKVFLPTISSNNASNIDTTNSLAFLSEYDVTMEASYSVIYESEGKGDAEYRFYKTEKNVSGVAFASGLLTNAGAAESSSKVLVGVIRVSEVPLTYSCDPVYGCTPDPAGSYTENTCEGNCTYRSFDPGGGTGSLWLWDAFYRNLGIGVDFPDDATDEFKETWTKLTDLIYNGERFALEPANSGQYEYTWWKGSDGLTHYTGHGGTGMAAGSLPSYSDHGTYLLILSTQRPRGWPSSLSGRDLITGEIIEEEDFIEFNF